MFRPRIIPSLLLSGKGLVKTSKFKNPKYIGDPINAVRIFNDLEADELIFLDILASKEKKCIDINLVKNIGDEAYMPFAVGGGITSLEQVKQLISAGAEKVVINSSACTNPNLLKEISQCFGSQSLIVSIDVKKTFLGKYRIFSKSGSVKMAEDLVEYAKKVESIGAGEIMITSIDLEGSMKGYDLELIRLVADNVTIPVIANGGAGQLSDLKEAVTHGHASAVAAGSMFVFHGQRKAVLINYPNNKEIIQLFSYEKTGR